MSTTVIAERYKTKVPPSLRSQFKRVNKPEAVNKYREGQKRASTRSVNILKDKDFEKSRKVLAAKRKSLIHEHSKGNKPQATTAFKDKDEDAHPVSLQRTVWSLLSLHFGFRAKDESRKLCWGDVQLQQDKDDKEMLVWLSERETKTRHGQEKGHQRAFPPKIYATKSEQCPVKFYKTFKSHRPIEMNQPQSPFYLALRQNRASQDQVW